MRRSAWIEVALQGLQDVVEGAARLPQCLHQVLTPAPQVLDLPVERAPAANEVGEHPGPHLLRLPHHATAVFLDPRQHGLRLLTGGLDHRVGLGGGAAADPGRGHLGLAGAIGRRPLSFGPNAGRFLVSLVDHV